MIDKSGTGVPLKIDGSIGKACHIFVDPVALHGVQILREDGSESQADAVKRFMEKLRREETELIHIIVTRGGVRVAPVKGDVIEYRLVTAEAA